MTQRGSDKIPDIGTARRVVPTGPADQVLHASRVVVTGMFRDRPAVLHRQRRQQPVHEAPDPAPRLGSGEARPDRVHQLAEQLRPSLSIYSVSGGHRRVLIGPHNPQARRWLLAVHGQSHTVTAGQNGSPAGVLALPGGSWYSSSNPYYKK